MNMPNYKATKNILNKTKKRDAWFLDDYTINMYSGCSFNCLFCYIRGSKYGEHMERSLSMKTNALEILDRQLYNRAKKGQYGIIVLSSATDPYLHFEKEYEQTREALKLIQRHRFPVHIITRSPLVERDIDILHQINSNAILPLDLKNHLNNGALITFSFSGLDDEINKIFEPGAPSPSERLETIKVFKKEKFKTGISLMPLLPYITDTAANLEYMFGTFKKLEIDYIYPASLTLFGNGKSDSKTLVLTAIKKHFPELENKYLHFFQQSHQMPNYYKKALEEKIADLCKKYDLRNSIITLNENTKQSKSSDNTTQEARLF